MIKETVRNFIKKHELSGTFIVAFSGGYDSMCLLDVLHKLKYDLVAVHLNHNWRVQESLAEAKNCENFAKSRKIKFYSEVMPDDIEKTETAAREARYEFFKRCAEKFKSNVVFTAHNFDDNAETVLYRIIKGTGSIGLQGIAENRDIFYRPLLSVKREDIEAYCAKNLLFPNKDSSNYDVKYNRNFIRHEILPLMRKINPKVSEALNSLSELAKEDNEIINDCLPKDLNKSKPAGQKKLIQRILCEHNIEYDKKKIADIQKFINENKNSKCGKKMSLSSNLWLFTNVKGTEIISKKEKNSSEIHITSEGKYEFDNKIFEIIPVEKEVKTYPADSDFKAYINTGKIDFVLRHRKDGDKIYPLGANGSQKLKKYLNEKKIPLHKRDELVFLCKGSEVLWAAGVGISENIKVNQKSTHVISLRGKS